MASGNGDHLVVFTTSYPFSRVVESFLDREIPHLSSAFDTVTLVPRLYPPPGERIDRSLPKNISIETSIMHDAQKESTAAYYLHLALSSVASSEFYSEFRRNYRSMLHPAGMRKALGYLGIALDVRDWVARRVEEGMLDPARTLLYTYWFDGTALGVVLARRDLPGIRCVSRAHGYDLYAERYTPPYMPFEETRACSLDRVYPVSEHGRRYLSARHPSCASGFRVARLGTGDPGFLTPLSQDGVFRVVSCSHIIPIKRIDLLIRGLAEAGRMRPDHEFEWVHIGGGALQAEMEAYAGATLSGNVSHRFTGYLANAAVLDHYRQSPVDVFINVSESEGVPVSIMEAESCGIPVIATAVGGTPEIVSGATGILLPENPAPREIAEAVCRLAADPDGTRAMRSVCRENWERNYNADRNFSAFAGDLQALLR
ncbi:glycosyltransferase [Methanoculleus sp. 7T]|uniref:glycosyltransferase n=1 Tax=Methanoculleus sp. 7T TaxID=2937282 RepID=UPI0020BE70E5|nr:glycosyltransferase [Methanoculleus sp. 7T]MCK8519397.1 glycosyltransferase [Methanoculleus sp. 7T]